MFKRPKAAEILSATELLRVASVNTKISKPTKAFLVFFVSLISLLLLLFGLLFVAKDAPLSIKMAWIFLISLAYIVMLLLVLKVLTRSAPLIITEKGVIIGSYLAELWEDIDGYGWETFQGIRKVSFSSRLEGACLYILNKGTFQRNIETWTGHTMLAQYGLFFTPEQIAQTEKIFQHYGIRKLKELDVKEGMPKQIEKQEFNVSRILTQLILYVLIPTCSIFLLQRLRIISLDFTTLLLVFGIIDACLIGAIILGARKRSSEKKDNP